MENVRSEDRTYLQEFPQIMPDQLPHTLHIRGIEVCDVERGEF